MTEAKLKEREMDEDLVNSLLGKTSPSKDEAPPPLRPQEIIKGTANHYQITAKQIRGLGRKRQLVTPRHVAMYLLRIDYKLPLTEIGVLFSNRDHTTVMHAVEKVTGQLKDSVTLREDVGEIRKVLYQ